MSSDGRSDVSLCVGALSTFDFCSVARCAQPLDLHSLSREPPSRFLDLFGSMAVALLDPLGPWKLEEEGEKQPRTGASNMPICNIIPEASN